MVPNTLNGNITLDPTPATIEGNEVTIQPGSYDIEWVVFATTS